MLKKINKIDNIRNLKILSPIELLKYNLIYARNWSWKTNLSNFLNYFSVNKTILNLEDLKSLEAIKDNDKIDFDLEFEWEQINTTTTELKNNLIYIYNQDFINKCINIDDFSKKDHKWNIILSKVWELNNEIEKLEKQKEFKLLAGSNLKKTLEKDITLKVNELSKKYKAQQNTISKELYYDNLFNIKLIEEYKNDFNILNSIDNYKKIDILDENDNINFNFKVIDKINIDKIKSIIFKPYNFNFETEKIEKYVNSIWKKWIEEWLHIHNNWENCPFCQQPILDKNILKWYDDYLKSEKNIILNEIDTYINLLSDIKKSISLNIELEKNNIKKIDNLIDILWINKKIHNIKEIDFDFILTLLEEKKESLNYDFANKLTDFLKYSLKIEKEQKIISESIEANNLLIKEINKKIVENSSIRTELRKLIAKKELIDFFELNKSKIQERNQLLKDLAELNKKLEDEKAKQPTWKKEIIIKIFKSLLKTLYINKYDIDDNFNLKLISSKHQHAISDKTNLVSHWEKNVIAFCYYIASTIQYIDTFPDLEKLTLLIDDPVESTSYNYLHWIWIIIWKLPEILNINLWNDKWRHISPQIIILTHNLNFYNWFLSNSTIWKKYTKDTEWPKDNKRFVWKIMHLTWDWCFCTSINEVNRNNILSEFDTSLLKLIQYKSYPIWNIWADIRRVLEWITSFYSLDYSWDSFKKIFKLDENLASNILQFISHDFTHLSYQKNIDSINNENLIDVVNELYDNLEKLFPEKIKILEKLEKI